MMLAFYRSHARAIKAMGAVCLLAAAAYVLDWRIVGETLARVSPWWFLAVFAIALVDHLILGWRWYIIVRENVDASFVFHLRRYLIAVFLSTFAPGAVGGDIYRFVALKSGSQDRWLLAGAIVRDRIVGLTGLAVFYLACLAAFRAGSPPGEIVLAPEFKIAAGLLFLGVLGLVPARPLLRWIADSNLLATRENLRNTARLFTHALHLGSLGWACGMLLLSFLVCSMWGGSIYLLALGTEVIRLDGWLAFCAFAIVGVLSDIIRALPITFQGIGVREWAFAYLLTHFGASFDAAFVLGTTAYLAVSLSILAAGAIGFLLPSADPTAPVSDVDVV